MQLSGNRITPIQVTTLWNFNPGEIRSKKKSPNSPLLKLFDNEKEPDGPRPYTTPSRKPPIYSVETYLKREVFLPKRWRQLTEKEDEDSICAAKLKKKLQLHQNRIEATPIAIVVTDQPSQVDEFQAQLKRSRELSNVLSTPTPPSLKPKARYDALTPDIFVTLVSDNDKKSSKERPNTKQTTTTATTTTTTTTTTSKIRQSTRPVTAHPRYTFMPDDIAAEDHDRSSDNNNGRKGRDEENPHEFAPIIGEEMKSFEFQLRGVEATFDVTRRVGQMNFLERMVQLEKLQKMTILWEKERKIKSKLEFANANLDAGQRNRLRTGATGGGGGGGVGGVRSHGASTVVFDRPKSSYVGYRLGAIRTTATADSRPRSEGQQSLTKDMEALSLDSTMYDCSQPSTPLVMQRGNNGLLPGKTYFSQRRNSLTVSRKRIVRGLKRKKSLRPRTAH